MSPSTVIRQIKSGQISICSLSDAQIAAIWDCAKQPTKQLFSALMSRCCCSGANPGGGYGPPPDPADVAPRITLGQVTIPFADGVPVGLSGIPAGANHAEIRSADCDSLVNVGNLPPNNTNSYLIQCDATLELESADELANFQGAGAGCAGNFVVTYFAVNDDHDQND